MNGIDGISGNLNTDYTYNYATGNSLSSDAENKFGKDITNPFSDSDNKDKDGSDKTEAEERALKRSGAEECETCKNRKYQDGSDEMVSFKAAAHISPEASASTVRAHEQEHVSNAYIKADTNDGRVVSTAVSLTTSVCPECGRTYVSGGLTTSQIKYNTDAYSQNTKKSDVSSLAGLNVDENA